MSRRVFLGTGMAASATASQAGMIWLKSKGTGGGGGYYATVNSGTALQALLVTMRSNRSYDGKTIGILDGDYTTGGAGTGGIFVCGAIPAASTITFYGDGYRTATLPGVDFSAATNLLFTRIKAYRAYDAVASIFNVGTNQTDSPAGTGPSTNCGVSDSEVYGDPLSAMDFRFTVGSSGGAGSFVDNEPLYTVNSLQVPNTSHLATGTYMSSGSSAHVHCFLLGSSTSTLSNWNGKILQNATGTAWVTLSNPANISSPVKTVNTTGVQVHIFNGFGGFHSGFSMTANYIHDVNRTFANNGINQVFNYNTCVDVYQNGGDHEGQFSGAQYIGNTVEHIWATNKDGATGTLGPHQSLLGFSASGNNVSNVTIEGNVNVPGFNRFDHPVALGGGVWCVPSGPEINDQNNTWTVGGGATQASISGDVLTIVGPWPTGGPSSVAAGNAVMWGPDDTSGNVLSPADGLIIQAFGTGGTTGTGLAGTYKLSASAGTVSTGVIMITSVNTGWVVRSNLWLAGDNIGHEVGYARNSTWLYNTILTTLDGSGNALSNFYRHDLYSGNLCSKNVVGGFTYRDPVDFVSADFITNSSDNIVGLKGAASTSPASFYQMYNGLTGQSGVAKFSRLDAAGALEAFTPNPAGRIPSGYGHSAYYDFDTQTSNYPATPTPVSSNVSTGVSTTHVAFDGSTYSRWNSATGANMLEFTTGDHQFTIILQFLVASDTAFYYLAVGKNNAFKVQRNTDGTLTFLLNGTSSTACVTATTSFTVNIADGLTTVMFSVDTNTYQLYATKGNFIDPQLEVTVFTGESMFLVNGNNNCNIGNNYTGTSNEFAGTMGIVAINNSFVDVSTAAGLAKVIAQDNNPVSYGSQASTLFGSAAKVYINTVAGAAGTPNTWNATAGVNLGTTSAKFVKQSGSYTDAA